MENKIDNDTRNHFITLQSNGEVSKLSSLEMAIIENTDVQLVVHCEYQRITVKGYSFYTNTLYNSSNELIHDNTFFWKNIKCKIQKHEEWQEIKEIKKNSTENWKDVALVSFITDMLGVEEMITFYNAPHDGVGFKMLLNYLNDLKELQSHTAVAITRNLLQDKNKVIEELKAKSLINLLFHFAPEDDTFLCYELLEKITKDDELIRLLETIIRNEKPELVNYSISLNNGYIKYKYRLTEHGMLLKQLGNYEVYKLYQSKNT